MPFKTIQPDPSPIGVSFSRTAATTIVGKVYIVLPAFNEAEALPDLLAAIRSTMQQLGLGYEVIVVDDGSSDATAEIASRASFHMPLDLICHAQNQGLGATVRSGLEAALGRCKSDDWIVTMDADNTHPPELMIDMFDCAQSGPNVVIASMYQPGANIVGVPAYRRLLSLGGRMAFQMLFPISGVRCYTSGYRAIRAGVLIEASEYYGDQLVSEPGFSSTVDMLLKLRRFRIQAAEVPLLLRYDRKPGSSKMPVMRTIAQTCSLIVRRRFGDWFAPRVTRSQPGKRLS